MEFTKSQKDAISAAGSTILVSAAAGSGKTFTLTQRIIKSIIGDGENCADMLKSTGYEQVEIIEDLYRKNRFTSAIKPLRHG